MLTSRREFLRCAAASGAALAWRRATAAEAKPVEDLNVAFIGTGSRGKLLLEAGLGIPGLRVKAFCDIWEYNRRYASRYIQKLQQSKPSVYADCEELLAHEKDLDACIVATSPLVCAKHTVACLKAGFHTYSASAMPAALQGARDVIAATRETGKLVQLGRRRRSNPLYRQALELITQERLCGRITNCHATDGHAQYMFGPELMRLDWPERFTIPADQLKRHGYDSMEHYLTWERGYWDFGRDPLWNLGSRQVDVLNWFLGARPSSVVATGNWHYYENSKWPADVTALYEYETVQDDEPTSVRAVYQSLSTTQVGGPSESFMGDGGTLVVSEEAKRSYCLSEPSSQLREWLAAAATQPVECGVPQTFSLTAMLAARHPAGAKAVEAAGRKFPWAIHLENFCAAVRANDRRLLTCPPELAYPATVAAFGVQKAIRTGEKVRFREEDFRIPDKT